MTRSPSTTSNRARRSLVRFRRSTWRRELGHLAFIALKTVGFLFLLAWLAGIPGALVTPSLQRHTDPFVLKISRITWSPLRGVVAHRVRLIDPARPDVAVFRAREIVVTPDYQAARRWSLAPGAAEISGGGIAIPLATADREAPRAHVRIRDLTVNIAWTSAGIGVAMTGQSGVGTRMEVEGLLLHHHVIPRPDQPEPATGLTSLRALLDRSAQAPPWLAQVYERLSEAAFSSQPVARLKFHLDPADAANHRAVLTWEASDFSWRDSAFTRAAFACTLERQRIAIDQATVELGGQHVMVEGDYHITNDLFNARIYGDLHPEQLEQLLPARWRGPLDRAGIRWDGKLHAEGWLGPCGIADIPRKWSGWVSLEQGFLNEFPVERAFASFRREPPLLLVQDGLIEGGIGPGRGALRFGIRTDYTNRITTGTLDLGIEMKQFSDALPPGLQRLAGMFDITTQPIHFLGDFHVPFDDFDQLVVTGDITGENFFFRTVPVNRADVHLVYTNDIIHLDPFMAQCPTGSINGALVLDLPRDLYGIDLEVTANPHHVAPMVGTNFASYFQPYRFTDDIMLRVQGLVDVEHDALTDLRVHASGKRIGWGRLTADHLLLQAHRTPGLLTITNIAGSIAQGSVTGVMTITHAPELDTFTLQLGMEKISLDGLSKMFNPASTNRFEGILGGRFSVHGIYPDEPGWTNLTGSGSVVVEKGRLLLIPVFGGLSTLLSKMYPGLGFSEQNFADATFSVIRGRVRTGDLKIHGNLVSLAAKGHYTFDHHMKFDVLVHPFRDGTLASAVRIVTLPLSKLLEFNVSGPATNPVWNAVNIPFL